MLPARRRRLFHMASRSSKGSAPLTFDLPGSLIEKIQALRKGRALKTASEVVRLAIEQFDFSACAPEREDRQQISVRVTNSQRAMLKRYAKGKDSSVGELIRLALDDLPIKAPRAARR
jgi:Arc/MetJ-type ribon-helix-helix transcriptional regulator